MTTRLVMAMFAFVTTVFSQTLPSYQWSKEVDGSGTDTVAGTMTDAQGNIYVVGSTTSPQFPVKSAVQAQSVSSALYRINGTASTPLGLSSVTALTADPQNPSVLYAVSHGLLLKSSDAGVTFSAVNTPSSQLFSITLEPGNSQILFASTIDQGLLKSTDSGATWTAINNGVHVLPGGGFTVRQLWIDPANVNVMFAETPYAAVRTGDGGASWQHAQYTDTILNMTFDSLNPGVIYITDQDGGPAKSTDYGLTFAHVTAPGVTTILYDPIQAGRLIGLGAAGIYQSTDGGATWTQESATSVSSLFVADTVNGVYYAATSSGIARISQDLQTVTPVGPKGVPAVSALAVVNGQLYAGNSGSADVYVTKLDSAGNVIYSTFFGGSADDEATAIFVDAAGNVYVTGTTVSLDFPVSKGAYAASGSMFVFKLNPDGSMGYSTYFSGTTPTAIAVNASGSAWVAGITGSGSLPVTPGTMTVTMCCSGITIGPEIIPAANSLTRFDAAGSSLIFSTYIPGTSTNSIILQGTPSALAIGADDTAYFGSLTGIFHINSTGSAVIASMGGPVDPAGMAFAADGSLYLAGANSIGRVDAGLTKVIATTTLGKSAQIKALTTDAAGNIYVGGATLPVGLPTRTPFNEGFAPTTGFLSEFSGDLSTLLFSSYFGDMESFTVSGVGISANGRVVIGGATGQMLGYPGRPGNVWLNDLSLTPPPALRIDAVENAASLLDGPISAGETIVITGAGFGSDAQLMMSGQVIPSISITPTAITATVPASILAGVAALTVQSGGVSTNQVLVPVAAISPGVFSANGTGLGQGYILNKDGSFNTPANPAAPSDRITIFATGVGPVSFTDGYAVSQYPVNIFIDGLYCDGVAAVMGSVDGLPGSVYQITVYVPSVAATRANDPNFVFPPLTGLTLQVDGVTSQTRITISIAQ